MSLCSQLFKCQEKFSTFCHWSFDRETNFSHAKEQSKMSGTDSSSLTKIKDRILRHGTVSFMVAALKRHQTLDLLDAGICYNLRNLLNGRIEGTAQMPNPIQVGKSSTG
jgi:hypothetical protein